ncbi:MAG: hypothetical protein ABH983_04580 [Candidatus Micrarchaeota archaeon]
MRSYFLIIILFAGIFGCTQASEPTDIVEINDPIVPDSNASSPKDVAKQNLTEIPGELINPTDLKYLGAFRLPEASGGSNWEYSGYAATYYPEGDPDGTDEYPGSIFAIGHDHHQQVSEISIPEPIISSNIEDLNTATTLQEFSDITGGMFGELEIPRAGLAYLPAQENQNSGKIYFSWGQHHEDSANPSFGWSELDLSNPQTTGAWYFGTFSTYTTNDYMFDIPENWAAENTPELRLATGRFRDGLWSGRGPALYAYGPYNEGNPPEVGSTLEMVTPLLLYGEQVGNDLYIQSDESMAINNFAESDEWSGGSWLTTEEKSAVIIVGTRGVGDTWYGFSNGVVYPVDGVGDAVYPDVPDWPHDARGWWSEDIEAQILFYNPADLAKVANGEMKTYEPQPYAIMNINEYLYDPGYDYERGKMYSLGAVTFDRENGLLYVFERLADEDEKSIVHVWEVA